MRDEAARDDPVGALFAGLARVMAIKEAPCSVKTIRVPESCLLELPSDLAGDDAFS
jgi:hypothetical protein